ncbi:MAG: hypothetical protein M3159_06150, partial [Actinomycetota bacterium]|nr:hypothetical protein [Actinomycetota bacterium]
SYPDICIPPPPPILNCNSPELDGETDFTVLPPDPHGFDTNKNGIGCETDDNGNLIETGAVVAGQTSPTTAAISSTPTTTPQASTGVTTTTTTTKATTATSAAIPKTGFEIKDMSEMATAFISIGGLCVWRTRRRA